LAVLALLAPAAAQARTKSVYMGVPPKSQSTFQNTYSADVNAFFPRSIAVNRGDKVRFVPVGFHTVEFPPKGSQPTALFGPDGNTIAGDNDAAGQPFWFNGQDEQFFSQPIIQSNNFGKTLKYTGKQRVETGLPLADHPAPMTVKFPKAGRIPTTATSTPA
jgi:plastocyanin